MTQYYYHAGVQYESDHETRVDWSDTTRRSAAAAESEARKLADKFGDGGKPVVEYWDTEHGLRPGWDCAEGAYDVK